jgi:hypothetical protein
MQRILTSLVNLDALFFLSIVQSMKQQYAFKCALLFLVWLPCCLPNFHVYWCGGVLFLMDSIKHADISLLFICSVVFQTALGQGIHGLCLTLHTRIVFNVAYTVFDHMPSSNSSSVCRVLAAAHCGQIKPGYCAMWVRGS